ncbi:hypothetical protein [Desulfofustis limnaeus]|uniref:Uncharacterized protein n=1 Tax=Desulfofustis limnaeus TaxID=2740163 RepID=A0ABN6MAY9_9BACT|nr:hypothetical protein [Desulfofustis limnaeus]BDD88723.1 hypothetical protein DPPLL_30880 [Desulfofustis limnaeus]
MEERVPVPFVTRRLGQLFGLDEPLVRVLLWGDGTVRKEIGVCAGCGCDIEAGALVCDDCRKWTGVWARQAAEGVTGSVRLCLEELQELLRYFERSAVAESAAGAGGGEQWLCAGCGCETGPGVSLCEGCEAELMSAQGAAWR